MNYQDAGVLPAGPLLQGLLSRITPTDPRVLLPIGQYANVIQLSRELAIAITTDGVGSKIDLARQTGKWDTIGIDCVAMNVNDLLCVGADPIAMVDYIGVNDGDAEILEQIGIGLAKGAEEAGISIVGGELSQIPGILRNGRIDLVGTAIGTLRPSCVMAGAEIREGDVLIGFASSGLHANGYTLATRALGSCGTARWDPGFLREIEAQLLTPTRIYRGLRDHIREGKHYISALAHITGGGLLNLIRLLEAARAIHSPWGPLTVEIDFLPPPGGLFELIQAAGKIPDAEMYRVFNMGIGFCLFTLEEQAEAILERAAACGIKAWVLGRTRRGTDCRVILHPHGLVSQGDHFVPL